MPIADISKANGSPDKYVFFDAVRCNRV